METPLTNRAWLLVLPVLALVAFSAVLPLMTVVNYSFQDTFGGNQFFWAGLEWFDETIRSDRVRAALGRHAMCLHHENRTVFKKEARKQLPCLVVTGFLGSGKTTLFNRILTASHGKCIAVIQNEKQIVAEGRGGFRAALHRRRPEHDLVRGVVHRVRRDGRAAGHLRPVPGEGDA